MSNLYVGNIPKELNNVGPFTFTSGKYGEIFTDQTVPFNDDKYKYKLYVIDFLPTTKFHTNENNKIIANHVYDFFLEFYKIVVNSYDVAFSFYYSIKFKSNYIFRNQLYLYLKNQNDDLPDNLFIDFFKNNFHNESKILEKINEKRTDKISNNIFRSVIANDNELKNIFTITEITLTTQNNNLLSIISKIGNSEYRYNLNNPVEIDGETYSSFIETINNFLINKKYSEKFFTVKTNKGKGDCLYMSFADFEKKDPDKYKIIIKQKIIGYFKEVVNGKKLTCGGNFFQSFIETGYLAKENGQINLETIYKNALEKGMYEGDHALNDFIDLYTDAFLHFLRLTFQKDHQKEDVWGTTADILFYQLQYNEANEANNANLKFIGIFNAEIMGSTEKYYSVNEFPLLSIEKCEEYKKMTEFHKWDDLQFLRFTGGSSDNKSGGHYEYVEKPSTQNDVKLSVPTSAGPPPNKTQAIHLKVLELVQAHLATMAKPALETVTAPITALVTASVLTNLQNDSAKLHQKVLELVQAHLRQTTSPSSVQTPERNSQTSNATTVPYGKETPRSSFVSSSSSVVSSISSNSSNTYVPNFAVQTNIPSVPPSVTEKSAIESPVIKNPSSDLSIIDKPLNTSLPRRSFVTPNTAIPPRTFNVYNTVENPPTTYIKTIQTHADGTPPTVIGWQPVPPPKPHVAV